MAFAAMAAHTAGAAAVRADDAAKADQAAVCPGKSWEHRSPRDLGLSEEKLQGLAAMLGGRGCVVRHGYVAAAWGDQAAVGDWASSAKPVLSTMLFFAIEEGLVKSVDQPIADFGWELREKDRAITFRHLGAMTSGYARPEAPGQAWAYNDFAIALYQKTLFDRVFRQDAAEAALDPRRLGALQFEDALVFSDRRRLSASVRDFARIVWFWRRRGEWNGRQVLPRRYFDDYMRPQTPRELPASRPAETDDYLKIGTYGGGSSHFSECGPGVYGFNWWFNDVGRDHPKTPTWPDAPADAIMSIGARGNSSVFIASLDLALVCASGDWTDLAGGDRSTKLNQALKLLAESVR